jgi:TRAP-type C4-dicarboxylate transport system permease small subunit
MSVRCLLDTIYRTSGALACASVVGILLAIVLQMLSRYTGFTFDATEISGFLLAAATFLGLGYTFTAGAHIRVSALIRFAQGSAKRGIELANTALAAAAMIYFAVYAAGMVMDSYSFGDRSPGLMAVPFWIAQVPMTLGLVVLAIGLVDEFIAVLRGKEPNFRDVEEAEVLSVLEHEAPPPQQQGAGAGSRKAESGPHAASTAT